MKYIELKDRPVNPNHVKYYSLVLSGVAALIALVTVKSNYDYFSQYYDGFGFWMRLIPFFAVEIAIITLPLAGGFGNKSQWQAAKVCEVVLIVLSLIHTSLVSQSGQIKIQAEKTKAEAQIDFDRAQTAANQIAAQNKQLQDSYNNSMLQWRRAANIAKRSDQQIPSAPAPPQLMTVPQIDQKLISNSTMSTTNAGESEVSHVTLLRLLYLMIFTVVISATAMVLLADATRIRSWLLKIRAQEIKHTINNVLDTNQTYAPPVAIPQAESVAQGQNKTIGFSPPFVPVKTPLLQTVKPTNLQTVKMPVSSLAHNHLQPVKKTRSQTVKMPTLQPVKKTVKRGALQVADKGLCLSPTSGGYSITSSGGEYLCYAPKTEAQRYVSMPVNEVLAEVRSKVLARKEGGNKVDAVTEIEKLIAGH